MPTTKPKKTKKPPLPPPVLAMRLDQAAASIGISPRKLQELTLGGKVPFAKIGRTVVYPADKLKAWLEAQMEATQKHA